MRPAGSQERGCARSSIPHHLESGTTAALETWPSSPAERAGAAFTGIKTKLPMHFPLSPFFLASLATLRCPEGIHSTWAAGGGAAWGDGGEVLHQAAHG